MSTTKEMDDFINRLTNNGVKPMTEYDYEICDFIIHNIDDTSLKSYGRKKVNIKQMCIETLKSFYVFNDDSLNNKVFNTIKNTTIYLKNNHNRHGINNFNSKINSSEKDENGLFISKGITIPAIYDDLAPVYYGHEICHIMKDRHPNEYKNMLKYADVIPMFYELVASDNYDDTSKAAIINNRFALLKLSENHLSNHNIRYLLNHTTGDYNNYIYDVIDSKTCQYLNSFYYSLLLYQMYEINPKYVLSNVRDVLLGKMTTDDLIYKFGFRDRSMDIEVKDQLAKLKKINT